MAKIGINGFGRIGRLILRGALSSKNNLDFVAINNPGGDIKTWAHLLKYDSNFGKLNFDVQENSNSLIVDGKEIKFLNFKSPSEIPWNEFNVDLVIESSGEFTERNKVIGHIENGAKKVIITAPSRDEDITLVLGVNENIYDSGKHHIISNSSCTTNCFAPMAKVLLDNFGIKHGFMTTIHSYTNDQNILDSLHKDLRRARSAPMSIIPTTTGAAKAIGIVIPELRNKIDGLAIRVPTSNVSLVDFNCEVEKEVSVESVNAAFKKASETSMKGILNYNDIPLVSHDFIGSSYSCIFDSGLTQVINKNFVKVLGWYDNEWAYSLRVLELADYIIKKGLK